MEGLCHVANSKQIRGFQVLEIARCVVLGASRACSSFSLRGRCAGGEADQAYREAYAGLHRRVRQRGPALRWGKSRQTRSKTGGAGRGSSQEKWLCEPRRI